MRAHFIILCGALIVGTVLSCGCSGDPNKGPDASSQEDAGADGGQLPDGGGTPPDAGDAGTDGGGYVSDFTCDVGRQQGCATGESCLYTPLADGGTGSRCFAGACDVVRQDCASGQRCTYVLENGMRARACVDEGTSGEGEPCSLSGTSATRTFDTCKKGLYCVDTPGPDGGTSFVCQRFCDDASQCTAPQECNEVLRLTDTQELPLACGAAAPRCDLLAQDCASPLGCYPSTSRGAAVCAGSGSAGDGMGCDFSNQCTRGSACVGASSTARACRKLCKLPSGEPSCPSGTTCQALADYPGVGACVP